MWKSGKFDWTVKAALAALTVGLIALAILPVGAAALKLKPYSSYGDKYMELQVGDSGKSLSSFNGNCTASKHPAFTFAVIPEHGIPIKGNGKFKWSVQNAVNTPDGGTLSDTSKVTLSGQFTSKTKVSGSYQLHKAGCKKVTFKAKLLKD